MVLKGLLTATFAGLVVTVVALFLVVGRPQTPPSLRARASAPSEGRSHAQADRRSGQAVNIRIRTFTQRLDQAQVAATSAQQWAAIARDNDVVVLNSWNYGLIPVLKQANPAVQVWVYKDLSGVRSDDCITTSGACGSCPPGVTDSRYQSSGMGYCWVLRHHPEWFLKSAATGRPFQFKGFPGIWETDYGNPAYQRQWIDNVLADVHAHGWDGVDIDDALTTANTYGVAAKYPTSAAVQAATYSALQQIGSGLRRAGVASVVNVGYAPRFPGLWEQWLGPVGGLEQQFYLYGGPNTGATSYEWQAYQDEISACAAQHKSCWFGLGDFSPSVISRIGNYVLASFLLATDGRQLLSYGSAVSSPATTCLTMGTQVGPVRRTGAIWQREFVHGRVLVNPTSSTAAVPLGSGSDPVRSGGRARSMPSAIKLGPASGAVLGSLRHSCG